MLLELSSTLTWVPPGLLNLEQNVSLFLFKSQLLVYFWFANFLVLLKFWLCGTIKHMQTTPFTKVLMFSLNFDKIWPYNFFSMYQKKFVWCKHISKQLWQSMDSSYMLLIKTLNFYLTFNYFWPYNFFLSFTKKICMVEPHA